MKDLEYVLVLTFIIHGCIVEEAIIKFNSISKDFMVDDINGN